MMLQLAFGVGFSLLARLAADLAVAVTGLCFRASQWEKQHVNSYSYLPQLMCNIYQYMKCVEMSMIIRNIAMGEAKCDHNMPQRAKPNLTDAKIVTLPRSS